MNERAQKTYNLILENSCLGRKTTQREIYEKVGGYEWNESETAHDNCPAIWKDIKDINECMDIDQVVISKNFEYWVGTKEETEQYLQDLWKALAPRLKRYWLFSKKLKLDGNVKLFQENGNDYYECFIRSEIDTRE